MSDFLNRGAAPLAEAEWAQLDRIVVETARRMLVGRRFTKVLGPLGPAIQAAPSYIYAGAGPGAIGVAPDEDPNPLRARVRANLTLPILYKDFWLYWRDVELTHQFSIPLDLSAAAAAAAFVAMREDDLVLNGAPELGHSGLTNVPHRLVLRRRDWAQMGNAFRDAAEAMQRLVSAGFFGPFAMVVSPALYASMARVYENTGILEIEQVQKIMVAGVYYTPLLADRVALVVSVGPQNFDLLVGQDLITAYLRPRGMNHHFRVLESLVLRIHRPGAICTLEA